MRPLNGKLRIIRARVDDFGVELPRILNHPRHVFVSVVAIDAQEKMFIAEFVNEQVVYERALRREQSAVMRLSNLQLARIVRAYVLNRLQGLHAAYLGFAHVAHIEDAYSSTHGHVFVNRAAVGHGHIPSAEGNHLASGLTMHGVERSLFERCVG